MSSTPDAIEEERAPWRIHLVLFLATIASVVATGFEWSDGPSFLRAKLGYALRFAGSLLGVLTVHEAGHYIAARYHKVDASLPYFIPL
ncbi:MAG TPA: site-2 protease family protein, partial [Polyangiaceae bacterium]